VAEIRASPLGQEEIVFDLRFAPRLAPRSAVLVRIVGLGGFGLLEGLIVSFAILNAIQGQRGTAYGYEFTAAMAGVGCLFLLPYFGMGPGASSAVWHHEGFTLKYSSGRLREFRWDDPGLKIEIGELATGDRVEYDLTTRMPWHNDLTREMFEAILSEAKRRGLALHTQRVVTGATSIQIHTIRPAAT